MPMAPEPSRRMLSLAQDLLNDPSFGRAENGQLVSVSVVAEVERLVRSLRRRQPDWSLEDVVRAVSALPQSPLVRRNQGFQDQVTTFVTKSLGLRPGQGDLGRPELAAQVQDPHDLHYLLAWLARLWRVGQSPATASVPARSGSATHPPNPVEGGRRRPGGPAGRPQSSSGKAFMGKASSGRASSSGQRGSGQTGPAETALAMAFKKALEEEERRKKKR